MRLVSLMLSPKILSCREGCSNEKRYIYLHYENNRNENMRNRENPFKFGTIVEEEYFTDRVQEVAYIKQFVQSANHLVLISPRRFGKSSVVAKALKGCHRKSITVNMQQATSVSDLSAKLLKEFFKVHPMEKVRHLISHFRVFPSVSLNPVTGTTDISFQPGADGVVCLEDVFSLMENVHTDSDRLIVVLDEFQEIREMGANLDKQLRSIMQRHKHINYILLGSQESMMTDIFEKKKSPFYHFGQRMNLKKIPYDDFYSYIVERLPSVPESESCSKEDITQGILSFTSLHPYYTQQLASVVYEKMTYESKYDNVVEYAITALIQEHALDYERFWGTFNRTDRRVLTILAEGKKLVSDKTTAQSTLFSSLKKLVRFGYVNKTDRYELEDPFFGRWICAPV